MLKLISDDKFIIEDIDFYIKKNIKSYFHFSQRNRSSWWEINEFSEIKNTNKNDSSSQYFLIFENKQDFTLGHWFYESVIYLQYFEKIKKFLKKTYNVDNLKIHYRNDPYRSYKKQYFNLFNLEDNEIFIGELPINNVCIFIDIIACHDNEKNKENYEKFRKIIIDYQIYIEKKILNFNNQNNKLNKILFLQEILNKIKKLYMLE